MICFPRLTERSCQGQATPRRGKASFVHICCLLSFLSLTGTVPLDAQDLKRPSIFGICRVEFAISDIKKSAVFYDSLLGYRRQALPRVNGQPGNSWKIDVNRRQSIIIHDGLPPTQDERLLSIAFQTADAEGMRKYLLAKGLNVPSTTSMDATGCPSFSLRDPDGHAIQFIQLPAQHFGVPFKPSEDIISSRILHAGLTIRDTGKADAFYRAVLGFSETWRGGASDTATDWINMRVPDGTDYIEYMLVNKTVTRQQLGSLHHVALLVTDIQNAVDVLLDRSALYAYPVASPRIGRNNRWQLNLFDPDGSRAELMEPFPMRPSSH